MDEEREKNTKKPTSNGYFDFSEVVTYFFRKKDPKNKPGINLRMMHGINKIAIIVFLLALLYWLFKRLL